MIFSPGLSFSSGNDNVKAGLNAIFTYWNIFSWHKQQMGVSFVNTLNWVNSTVSFQVV